VFARADGSFEDAERECRWGGRANRSAAVSMRTLTLPELQRFASHDADTQLIAARSAFASPSLREATPWRR
jgi:hypothetical protein